MNLLKVPIYRNPALLALAKEAPYCFHCRKVRDGTIVACHANTQEMGKGLKIKAADIPAFLCGCCHKMIDEGPYDREYKQLLMYRAECLSMRWALENHPEVFT
jgi:hypothetical protein